jgi:UDPglucose 6-dehydrogenase
LPPDIVEDLYDKFGSDSVMSKIGPLRYVYSPEFLREKTWEKDAVSPQMMILAGNFHDCQELEMLYKNHSQIPNHCILFHTDYYTASMVKYSINTFLAMKVTFMNQIYKMYSDHDGHSRNPHPEIWRAFTDMLSADLRFGSSHLQVPGPDGQYGYGGSCLPKDIKAFIGYDKNERLSVLRDVELANTQIRLTGDSKPK